MNRENIIGVVEKNLHRLCVGQTFPTETALYRFLEIPMEKADGDKTVKAVVSLYVKWEKTGSLNRTGKPSKEIRVIEIIEQPEYEDGRKHNQGGNNEKYLPYFEPWFCRYLIEVLQESEDFKGLPSITYRRVTKRFFGLDGEDSPLHQSMDAKHRKHVEEYVRYLNSEMTAVTKRALNRLERNGVLCCRDIFKAKVIRETDLLRVGYPRLDTPIKELTVDYYFNKQITSKITIEGVWEEYTRKKEDGQEGQETLESILRPFAISEPLKKPVFISLADWEADYVREIEYLASTYLGYDYETLWANQAHWKKVTEYTSIIYQLIGWEFIYRAVEIDVTYKGVDVLHQIAYESDSERLKQEFLTRFEHRMCQVVLKRRLRLTDQKKAVFSKRRGPRVGDNLPYLALDKAVNQFHCRMFGLEEDEFYFYTMIYGI